MTHQEFAEYLRKVAAYKATYPVRMGQAYINCLPDDILNEVTGSDVDCFYDDNLIGEFLAWLEAMHVS